MENWKPELPNHLKYLHYVACEHTHMHTSTRMYAHMGVTTPQSHSDFMLWLLYELCILQPITDKRPHLLSAIYRSTDPAAIFTSAETVFTLCQLELRLSLRESI